MDSYSQWGSKVAMAWLDITPKSHKSRHFGVKDDGTFYRSMVSDRIATSASEAIGNPLQGDIFAFSYLSFSWNDNPSPSCGGSFSDRIVNPSFVMLISNSVVNAYDYEEQDFFFRWSDLVKSGINFLPIYAYRIRSVGGD
jgi:hypothetical protein